MFYKIEWSDGGAVKLGIYSPEGEVMRLFPRVVTATEAARLLKKSRRQIYRYIKRRWLRPIVKFSGEYWLDFTDLEPLLVKKFRKTPTLPSSMQLLFPEYNVKTLHLQRDKDLILARIFERGNRSHIRWLHAHVSLIERRGFIKEKGAAMLSARKLAFWSWFLSTRPNRSKQNLVDWGRKIGGAG